MTHWPRHGRITGPIVMIGFGSIGKGTLPLIERHFEFDPDRFVVIDPKIPTGSCSMTAACASCTKASRARTTATC